MYSRALLLIILVLSSFLILSGQQVRRFCDEQFLGYDRGSDGTPDWIPARGFWIIRDSAYTQESDEYDCVSYRAQPLSGSYSVEVTFRHKAGEPGAGIVFSGSGTDGTEAAHMGRFDGATTFITGYFLGGEFTTIASISTDSIRPGIEHTLKLNVDRISRVYSFALDNNVIIERQPLLFASGFLGLQSSGGSVVFRCVYVTPILPDTTGTVMDRIGQFALLQDGTIAVPQPHEGTIAILDSSGNRVRTLGRSSSQGGILDRPIGIARLADSVLIVCDTGTHRIHLISAGTGYAIWTGGGEGKGPGRFRQPVAAATDRARNIYVVDRLNHRIQVVDSSFRFSHSFGSDRLQHPSAIAIEGSSLFVLNTGRCRVEEYDLRGPQPSWKRGLSYGGGKAWGLAVHKGSLFLSLVQEVRKYAPPYTSFSSFRGRAIGFIAPRSLAAGSAGELYIADYLHGRIVVTDTSLLDPTPMLTTGQDGTTISWNSNLSGPGKILQDLSNEAVRAAPVGKSSFRATLPGSSATRRFRFIPTLKTIPSESRASLPYPLPPQPMPGKGTYARLPVVAVLFSDVRPDSGFQSGNLLSADDAENDIARVRDQIEDGVRFYWIHSGCKLHVDVTYVVVREATRRTSLYGSEWWYPPVESVLQSTLTERGLDLRSFSGVLYLTFNREFDSTSGRYVLSGKGGGFTSGVGTGKGYGISWWDVTRKGHNAGNNWLMVHEFNHQLDDIFASSGYPEYWFNHISPTIGTAAQFGEHFDANAYILRLVPSDEWYDLKFTSLRTFTDADDDGVPDRDLQLPLDEQRVGSNPGMTDSDTDGLSDLDEMRKSNWIIEGWGETYGDPARFPAPNNSDTDGDGIPDSIDPMMCGEIKAVLHRIPDGAGTDIVRDERHRIGRIRGHGLECEIRGVWEPGALHFTFLLNRPSRIKVMIDGNADGWFLGRDNLLLTLSPAQDTTIVSRIQVFDATNPEQWPSMNKELAAVIPVLSTIRRSGKGFLIAVRIGMSGEADLDLRNEHQLGLQFGVHDATAGDDRYRTLHEPNRLFNVRLRE